MAAGLPSLMQLNTTREADHELDPWSQNGRWFFSALYDTKRHFVDILADLPQHEALSATGCKFISSSLTFDLTTAVEAFRLVEWDTQDCYRLRCKLVDHKLRVEDDLRVGLTFGNSSGTPDLPSRPVEAMLPHTGHLAACVGPVFSARPYLDLKDYVQFYTDLGVGHFFVYVVGHDEAAVVPPDLSLPKVTWVQYKAGPTRFYSGQVPMMQDCHSRLRYAFDYLSYFDMDEFLMLKTNTTLQQFLHDVMPMRQSGPHQISALSFSTWEYPAHCNEGGNVISLIDPTGHGKLQLPVWDILQWGKSECVGHTTRTKNIVRARFVEQKSPHDVTEFVASEHQHLDVPCSDAHAKHFRIAPEHVVQCSDLKLLP